MGDETCPACGKGRPMAARGRPRVWCSDRCRKWVNKVGGPQEAADLLEGWASTWAASDSLIGKKRSRERAEELRGLATRLRGMAG